MPQMLGLPIIAIFTLWLFAREQKLRPINSLGLWVALLWITIIGSIYPSAFLGFGMDPTMETPDTLLEGSPIDRNIFLLLIVSGVIALLRRKPDWHKMFGANRWYFVFLIYCGVSIIWSDYPFVSLKRWIKELGNVIMVLLILTEKDPVLATRAVLARYAYIVVPVSVTLILFFPDIGTYLNEDMSVAYRGSAIDKNGLGVLSFICGLFLIWDFTYMRSANRRRFGFTDLFASGTLLSAVAWLIYIANSKTPLVCLVLGTGTLLLMKLPLAKSQVRYLGTYSLILVNLALFLYSVPGILGAGLEVLGRDVTFTGRTELWGDVLREHVNPLVGTGYQSFWLGSRADYFWQKYIFNPRQAHNGYLETYLNGGIIGLCLLMAALLHTGRKLKKELLQQDAFGVLLFAVLVAALFYNITEAMFGRFNVFWVILSIAALYCSNPHPAIPEGRSPAGRRFGHGTTQ